MEMKTDDFIKLSKTEFNPGVHYKIAGCVYNKGDEAARAFSVIQDACAKITSRTITADVLADKFQECLKNDRIKQAESELYEIYAEAVPACLSRILPNMPLDFFVKFRSEYGEKVLGLPSRPMPSVIPDIKQDKYYINVAGLDMAEVFFSLYDWAWPAISYHCYPENIEVTRDLVAEELKTQKFSHFYKVSCGFRIEDLYGRNMALFLPSGSEKFSSECLKCLDEDLIIVSGYNALNGRGMAQVAVANCRQR
jgi:hypothetical protein